MIKISPYSEAAVQQVFETLQRKCKEGITIEYEVHVDGEQAIPRTDKLDRFFVFQALVFQQTESIEIWLYKGTSRRYDKYVFELPKEKTFEELLKERTDEALRKQQQEWEHHLLVRELKDTKEKCKELKEDKKELKVQISQLEADAKNMNMMQGLVGIVKQSSFMKSEVPSELNGIPVQPLVEKLVEIQKELGDETFQFFLGTALMLGQHPKAIPEVRKLIEQSMNS